AGGRGAQCGERSGACADGPGHQGGLAVPGRACHGAAPAGAVPLAGPRPAPVAALICRHRRGNLPPAPATTVQQGEWTMSLKTLTAAALSTTMIVGLALPATADVSTRTIRVSNGIAAEHPVGNGVD